MNRTASACAIVTLGLLAAAGTRAQDDNLIPPGPPGSEAARMRSLNQIEPRTPIGRLPFAITAPGSYYVTGNLLGVPGSNGITILSSDVKLDLGGFALNGSPGPAADGISIQGGERHNITVQNGVVRDWPGYGFQGSGAQDSTVDNVKAFMNGYAGIAMGPSCLIRNCLAYGNGLQNTNVPPEVDDGIRAESDGTVLDCKSRGNRGAGINVGRGSRVSGCTAAGNQANGVFAADYCVVRDCTATGNRVSGITATGKCRILENTTGENRNDVTHLACGIQLQGMNTRVEENTMVGNDIGIQSLMGGNLVFRNTATSNTIDYQLHPTDRYGPIIPLSGGVVNNTNPWTNFQF